MNVIIKPLSNLPVLNLGFRIMFLGAAVYSVLAILLWMGIYVFGISIPMNGITIFQWHAHEMIYGYCLAVIAGFLLTAVKNWTGIQTIHGPPLAVIFLLWLIARVLFMFGSRFIELAGVFDFLFISSVIVAAAYPIIKAKNWAQLGILSKLILLFVFNLFFYLGYMGLLEQGVVWGIYGGLYLVIALVLTLSGRVIPFFIKGGVGYEVEIYNPIIFTVLGLLLFLVFFVSELFLENRYVAGITAIALFIVYSIRLLGWHTPGIWRKSLLWSLYVSALFINLGFLLFALSIYAGISRFIAIHAFAYGGIGLITLSMMARVILGHTGRNINQPPAMVSYMFLAIICGAVVRVFFPLILPEQYLFAILFSQLLWALAFLLFLITCAPMLVRERVDGKFG